MNPLRFFPFVRKQITRRPMRSTLTIAGVATAMFLFAAVQAMQAGVTHATQAAADETTLVVYRENRFCPFTSRLPERYEQRIAEIDGVAAVTPIQVLVSNCQASLDVVTFRGAPVDKLADQFGDDTEIIEGSLDDWARRGDAALVGESLAERRNLSVGDTFEAADVTVHVVGILRSDRAQDRNVAYVQLPFLQQTSVTTKLGVVTQFNVRVETPDDLDRVAEEVDAAFASDTDPTSTSSEQAFVARAAQDVVRIVGFTRWLGWGCLAAVLALVGNAIVLSMQDRVREHAVLQTLGYRGSLIARLIVGEGAILGLLGGAVGTVAALAFIRWGSFSLTSEGLSVPVIAGPSVVVIGLALSALLGVVAGLVPAWQASRRPITESFRAV
jgi:putative ABC transport system permease protein